MIVIKIIGGLGNQMFQYALYNSLTQSGYNTFADISEFGKEGLAFHNGFEIKGIFNLPLNLATDKQIRKVKNIPSVHYFIRRTGNLLMKKPLPHIRENDHIKQILKSNKKKLGEKSYYLDGYWQSEDFFTENEEIIRRCFTFPPFSDDRNKNLIDDMEKRNTVSIHVRGGDYINTPSLYKKYGCVCSDDYYRNAISLIREKVESPFFYIFSNDFDWVEKKLDIEDSEKLYIDWNSGDKSYNDMHLMSLCRHHIIANSSFSWWGAWLSKNIGITIAPSKWLGDGDKEEIYCNNWIRI